MIMYTAKGRIGLVRLRDCWSCRRVLLTLAAVSGWKRFIRMASRRVRPQRANANSEVPRETGVVYGDHVLGKSTSPSSSSLGS